MTDFINADGEVQAISDRTDAKIVSGVAGVDAADLSSDDDADDASKQLCIAAKRSSEFSLTRCYCGAIKGTGLDYLKRLNNIENGLMNFMAKN